MNIKTIFAFIAVLILFSNTIYSQWVKGKGKGYYKLSAWNIQSDQHYTDTGAIDPNITQGQFNISFYGEYGLADKLDVLVYLPFFSRSYQNDVLSGTTGDLLTSGDALNSVGDIDVGVSYSLFKNKNIALSTTLKFGLPVGKTKGSLQTGDGEFNQLVLLNLGMPFKLEEIPLYAKVYTGYNNRTEDFSDEFRVGLELGVNLLNEKLWLIGRLDRVSSLKNGSLSAQNNSQGSIFANNVEYTSAGIEAAYYISKKLGLSFNYTSAFEGRIIFASPSISGGIFLDVK